jgi:hypothetical protein
VAQTDIQSILKPGFLPTGFLFLWLKPTSNRYEHLRNRVLQEKPGFCWGQKREGDPLRGMQHRSKNGEGIVQKTRFLVCAHILIQLLIDLTHTA